MAKKKAKPAEKLDVRLRMDAALHKRVHDAARESSATVAAFVRACVVEKLRRLEGRPGE